MESNPTPAGETQLPSDHLSGASTGGHYKAGETQALADSALREWLHEREQNARAIASVKRGADKEAWLEDAAHFRAAYLAVGRATPPSHPQESSGPTSDGVDA